MNNRALLLLISSVVLTATACKTTTTAPPASTPPVESSVKPVEPAPAPTPEPEPVDPSLAFGEASSSMTSSLDAAARETRAAETALREELARDPFKLLDDETLRTDKDLVLVAVGDVSQPTKQWYEATMALKAEAFEPTKYLLDSGDLVFMNLENPISDLKPSAKKEYSFTSAPERLGWYFDVGFNMFSLSNNHIADADQQGIDDTLMHLEAYREKSGEPAWWAGAATTPADAEAATLVEPPGKDLDIAYFSTGFSKSPNVSKFWSASLIERIKEADAKHDIVIVSVHAGKEYKHIPDKALSERYRSWIDAGADLIIGHHPHVIRPVEVYKQGLILHSLGNHVFMSRTVRFRKYNAKMYGLVTRVIIKDGKVAGAEITPTWVNNKQGWTLPTGERIGNSNFKPTVLTGPFADAFFEDFNAWSEEMGATVPERVEDTGRVLIPVTEEP